MGAIGGASTTPAAALDERSAARGGVYWLAAWLLVALSAAMRVQLAFDDPGFDRVDPRGMLQSDPAELHYLGRAFAERGEVFRELDADPRIAWPDQVDVRREFTLGQEHLVGACARLFPRQPLHVVATCVGATTMALTALALFALALELLRSRRLALLAAATFVVLPASYRTVGFVWIREDLALPLLAAAAWATARAARARSGGAGVLAGALAALSAAAWHGAGVGLAVLAAATVTAAIASARPPATRAWLSGALTFALLTAALPALRAKGVWLSAPVSLSCAALLWRGARPASRRARALCAASVVVLCALARRAVTGDDLAHVSALFWAKLEHGGVLPVDPTRVSPDVRLMWQGPFEGLAPLQLSGFLGVPFVVALIWLTVVLGQAAQRRTPSAARELAPNVALSLAVLALLGASVLVARNTAFAALAVPLAFAAGARGMVRSGTPALGRYAALGLFGVQALFFMGFVARFEIVWNRPLSALEERRARVTAVADLVPRGAPILTDFLNGPALLADHDRPIVLQPKWETAAARARVHRFLDRLYHGTPEEFVRYVQSEARCEWFLLDRRALVDLRAMRYAAGLRRDAALPADSALAALLGPVDTLPAPFQLVLEIPSLRPRAGGAEVDAFSARLFRLVY